NMNLVASSIEAHATGQDLVVLNPFWMGITFQRYYKGAAGWVTVPPLSDVRIVRYDLVKATMERPHPLDPVFARIAKTLQAGGRGFWVQGFRETDTGSPPALPPAPLAKTGWYLVPYLLGWSRQASYFIETHALGADYVDLRPDVPVLPYENATIHIVTGW